MSPIQLPVFSHPWHGQGRVQWAHRAQSLGFRLSGRFPVGQPSATVESAGVCGGIPVLAAARW